MNALDVEAAKVLAWTPVSQRERFAALLDRAKEPTLSARGRELALDRNARLCTRIRELAEARRCPHPWSK